MDSGLQLRLLPGPRTLSLFRDEVGLVCLKNQRALVGRKTVVITMPKAGTYLIAKLLSEAGLVDLEIHCRLSGFSDYRFLSADEKIARASQVFVPLPLAVTLSLIQDGQFAVGHLGHDRHIQLLLEGFGRIVAIRETRQALVSFMRFEERRLRADPNKAPDTRQWIEIENGPKKMIAFMNVFGEWLLGEFRAVLPWLSDPDSVVCRFETLMGDYGEESQLRALDEMLRAAHLAQVVDGRSIFRSALGAETLTFSGQRSDRSPYWDGRVEAKFTALGGAELNAQLGYRADIS